MTTSSEAASARPQAPVTRFPVVRRVLCAAAVLLLLALAWWTTAGAIRNLTQARSAGQWAETAVQLACGLLAVATAVTRFRWRARARPVRIAWAATQAAWVGLAALVWGAPQPHVALLFGVVALLVSWGTVAALGPATPRASATEGTS